MLDRLSRDEDIIISRAGKPVAILEPYHLENRPHCPGRLRGQIRMADDFDELPSDISVPLGMVKS